MPAPIIAGYAATATGYILTGIAFEEHDLLQSLGETYAAYRARVPALIPRPPLRRPSPGPEQAKKPTRSRRHELHN
jgi:methanethiol S-methyltransferase